jgi:hypothetical protein
MGTKEIIALDERAFRVAVARAGYRSLASLARAIGLSPAYVRQIGHGWVPPVETRVRIAAAIHEHQSRLWRTARLSDEVAS